MVAGGGQEVVTLGYLSSPTWNCVQSRRPPLCIWSLITPDRSNPVLQHCPLPLAQWGRTAKNRDVSTGPLTRPFVSLLALLTHLLPLHCLLRSHTPLRSFLAHSLSHSGALGKVDDWMAIFSVFFSILD